mgnify:CR=1 FL=1
MSLPRTIPSNDVSKPNSVGIGPVSSLLLSVIWLSPDIDPSSVGMLPVSLLLVRSRFCKLVSVPICVGMVPWSAFLVKIISVKPWRKPISVAIVPPWRRNLFHNSMEPLTGLGRKKFTQKIQIQSTYLQSDYTIFRKVLGKVAYERMLMKPKFTKPLLNLLLWNQRVFGNIRV